MGISQPRTVMINIIRQKMTFEVLGAWSVDAHQFADREYSEADMGELMLTPVKSRPIVETFVSVFSSFISPFG
jgi:hypothetical protein